MGEASEGREDEPPDELEEFREDVLERKQEQPGEPEDGGEKETQASEESELPEPEGLDEFRQQVAAKYSEDDSH